MFSDEDAQLERLMNRNTLSEEEAKQRISSQMPLELKIEMADFVIENSGSLADTRRQTEDIIRLLRSYKRHRRNRIILGLFGLLVIGIFIFVIVFVTKKL